MLLLLIVSCVCFAQAEFDINKFSDPVKYGWNSFDDRQNYRNDLYERQKLLQLYEMDSQSISTNALKSSLIPGWGQFSTQNYTKGQVFLGLEIGLIGTSLFFYDKAMSSYNQYKTATQIDAMNTAYHNAQGPFQNATIFLGFAAVIWAYNIFDVVQSTEQYNSTVWQQTLTKYYEKPVQVTPQGLQIRF